MKKATLKKLRNLAGVDRMGWKQYPAQEFTLQGGKKYVVQKGKTLLGSKRSFKALKNKYRHMTWLEKTKFNQTGEI